MSVTKKIAVVVYSEVSRDARVRKALDVALECGFEVDCFSLKEQEMFEPLEHLNLIRTGIKQYRGPSNIKYILSYFSFSLIVFFKLSIRSITKKYKIVHVHNMPDFLVFSTIISKIRGSKIILDIHDSMPKVYEDKFDSSGMLINILKIQERLSAAFSDEVITVHDLYKEKILAQNGIDLQKITVIKNLPDQRLFHPSNKWKENSPSKKFRMVFHGTIAERYGLRTIIGGLNIIKENGYDFIFDIYGKGDDVEELKERTTKYGLGNHVFFHGLVPYSRIPKLIHGADLGVASLDGLEDGLSVKLLEYIGMNIPVITTKNHVIEYYFESDELFLYDKKSPISFANVLLDIIESQEQLNLAKKRLLETRKRFLWSEEKQKLIDLYF